MLVFCQQLGNDRCVLFCHGSPRERFVRGAEFNGIGCARAALSPPFRGAGRAHRSAMRRCLPGGEPLRYEHECNTGATPSETSFGRTPGAPARILLVDDDVVFGEATARVLRAAGFEVFLAPDHRLALEDLESTRPIDLLITDIVMPDRVNGVALSRMARMRRPGLKVIYLTAYDIPGLEDEAVGPVLRKPIDEGQLVAKVRSVLAAG